MGPVSWSVILPLLLAGVVWLLPLKAARWLSLVGGLATLAIGGWLTAVAALHPQAAFSHVDHVVWSASWGAAWLVGVDGIGASLLALSGLITAIATVSAWNEERQPRAYHALVLILTAGANGVFTALDALLFYVCWEVVLVPMLLLIGLWGGAQRRYAAMKFFVVTLAGSVGLLLMIVLMWARTPEHGRPVPVPPAVVLAYADTDGTVHGLTVTPGMGDQLPTVVIPRSFDLRHWALSWREWEHEQVLGISLAALGFAVCVIAFAVKVPLIPFHTWLPHAHVQAPTAISVILAGVLLKLGVYGFVRIAWPLFPHQAAVWAPWLAGIGAGGILIAAWIALMQNDLKRLVAYSSVSHMGFCLLGLASLTVAGVNGCVLQALTHGVGSALLFLLVGVIYDRAHHRRADGFGGLAGPMPRFSGVLLLGALTGCGLPGLAGFPGELLATMGAFIGGYPWLGVAAAVSVVISAAYLLWMVKRVAYGPLRHPEQASFPDLDTREWIAIGPLVVLAVVLGVWPQPLLDAIRPAVEALIRHCAGGVS